MALIHNHLVTLGTTGEVTWNFALGNFAEIELTGDVSLSINFGDTARPAVGNLHIVANGFELTVPGTIPPGWILSDTEDNATFVFNPTSGSLLWSIVNYGSTLPQLDAPGNFTATADGYDEIDLAWDNVANEANFEIQESADGISWSALTAPAANTLLYAHTGLDPLQHVYYRLRAVGDLVTWSHSDWVYADETTDALPLLSTPGSFTAVADSDTEIDLSWSDVANEVNYVLQRASLADYSDAVTINSPAAGVTSYSDTGLTASTLYYYRLKAVGDWISFSDSLWATTSETTDANLDFLGVGGEITWFTAHDPEDAVLRTATNFIEYIPDLVTAHSNQRLVQATEARQPVYNATGLGGQPCVHITGQQFLKNVGYPSTATKPFTLLFACSFDDFAAQGSVGYVISGTGNEHTFCHWNGVNNQKPTMYSTTNLMGSSNMTAGTVYVVCAEFRGDANDDRCWINDPNTTAFQGNCGGTTVAVPGNLSIGDPFISNLGANAKVGKLRTYLGILSDADRIGAMEQLKDELGI